MRARKSAAQGQRVVINKIPISITSRGVGGGGSNPGKGGKSIGGGERGGWMSESLLVTEPLITLHSGE